VNQRQTVARLIAKANKYRRFAQWMSDLAQELRQRARYLARPDEDRIRTRAREIWEENGRPSGRDEEFWSQAEREFREAEELAKQNGNDVDGFK
jgi:hypothetical protein